MSGMGGPVSINQMAIHAAMELYNVEFRQDCFDKVLMLYREMCKMDNEKAQQKRSNKT